MPLYEYKCSTCNEVVMENKVQEDRDNLPICSICATVMRRLFGSPGVTFRGSGFYTTDK